MSVYGSINEGMLILTSETAKKKKILIEKIKAVNSGFIVSTKRPSGTRLSQIKNIVKSVFPNCSISRLYIISTILNTGVTVNEYIQDVAVVEDHTTVQFQLKYLSDKKTFAISFTDRKYSYPEYKDIFAYAIQQNRSGYPVKFLKNGLGCNSVETNQYDQNMYSKVIDYIESKYSDKFTTKISIGKKLIIKPIK